MQIPDPLFGVITIPDWLEPIIGSAEVQRLREVRLINTTTSSLPALSDTRRYTHTLGVVGLCAQLMPRLRGLASAADLKAFAVATVLHDVGTPAFGHLFEYLLKASFGWTHEQMLAHIIAGDYRPDGKYHQVYFGNQLHLEDTIEQLGLSPELISSYVTGGGQLGPLLAGTVDIDNIDNVYRMAQQLGFGPDVASALRLVDGLGLAPDGLMLSEASVGDLDIWRRWRRRAYEILAFDEKTLQAQAMLTDALSAAMRHEIISDEHWFMTDEQLLRFLYEKGGDDGFLRDTVRRYSTSDYYATVALCWFDQPGGRPDLREPTMREELRSALEDTLGIPCSPYVFYDLGTFEKQLRYRLTGDGTSASEVIVDGETSQSTVVGVFTPRRGARRRGREARQVLDVLAAYELDGATLRPIPTKRQVYGLAGQEELYR